uniref:Uncharacterized protein n=1 Tax=Cyclopterus lumpus TaxID=8103 RepID=A0A8C3G3G7_CYCLU
MSERRRSAAALSSRAHAFSVEALIGSNKKRKLRGWEAKELELSMDGEEPAHCLDMDPGQCAALKNKYNLFRDQHATNLRVKLNSALETWREITTTFKKKDD